MDNGGDVDVVSVGVRNGIGEMLVVTVAFSLTVAVSVEKMLSVYVERADCLVALLETLSVLET